MRKLIFLLILTLPSFLFPQEDKKTIFLSHYYGGDYVVAHDLLKDAVQDPVQRQIWEYRIHASQKIDGCEALVTGTPGEHAMALLRIGDVEGARKEFGEDWVSLWGKATLAMWESQIPEARESIQKALVLQPENPDIVYFAWNLATTEEESKKLFARYLDLVHDDPYRKAVAEYSMAFMDKTKGMDLNIPSSVSGLAFIDSDYKKGDLIIHAIVNQKQKVNLLLDTGSGGLTLKERDWEPKITSDLMQIGIGKKQINRGSRVVLDQFAAGPYTLTNPVAAVSPNMPSDIDGIAGPVLFSNHLIVVPLQSGKKMMIFRKVDGDPLAYLEERGVHFEKIATFPFHWINKLMILKGRIKDSPEDMDFLLDTGADRTMLSAAAAKRYAHINYPLSRQLGQKSSMTGVGGRSGDLLIAENVSVELGTIKKEFNQMTAINLGESSEAMDLELDLILGRDFLQGYALLIDYSRNQVTFLK